MTKTKPIDPLEYLNSQLVYEKLLLRENQEQRKIMEENIAALELAVDLLKRNRRATRHE